MTKIGAGMRVAESVWRAGRPVDVRRTLGPLVRGRGDLAHRTTPDGTFWRVALTPQGPATLALRVRAYGEVHAAAWGPGAEWAVAGVPDLLGARDDPASFVPRHPLLDERPHRHRVVRLVELSGVVEPRFAPRFAPIDYRRF